MRQRAVCVQCSNTSSQPWLARRRSARAAVSRTRRRSGREWGTHRDQGSTANRRHSKARSSLRIEEAHRSARALRERPDGSEAGRRRWRGGTALHSSGAAGRGLDGCTELDTRLTGFYETLAAAGRDERRRARTSSRRELSASGGAVAVLTRLVSPSRALIDGFEAPDRVQQPMQVNKVAPRPKTGLRNERRRCNAREREGMQTAP